MFVNVSMHVPICTQFFLDLRNKIFQDIFYRCNYSALIFFVILFPGLKIPNIMMVQVGLLSYGRAVTSLSQTSSFLEKP